MWKLIHLESSKYIFLCISELILVFNRVWWIPECKVFCICSKQHVSQKFCGVFKGPAVRVGRGSCDNDISSSSRRCSKPSRAERAERQGMKGMLGKRLPPLFQSTHTEPLLLAKFPIKSPHTTGQSTGFRWVIFQRFHFFFPYTEVAHFALFYGAHNLLYWTQTITAPLWVPVSYLWLLHLLSVTALVHMLPLLHS